MASVHNEMRRGVLSAALTRAVGDMRGAAGLERFGETLQPVIDLWRQPEWGFLRLEKPCAGFRGANAVAGEFAVVALVNPAASGVIAVVEAISMDAGGLAASTVMTVEGPLTEAQVAAALAGPAAGNVRDTRFSALNQFFSACVTYTGTEAGALGPSLEDARVPAGNMIYAQVGVPFVLHPGWAVAARLGTVNQAATFSFKWRERRAFPSELP